MTMQHPATGHEHNPGAARAAVVLPILALLAAACDSGDAPEPTIAVDSADVEIVTSDPFNSDVTCTLGEEPILSVGDQEDDENAWFSSIRGVARLSDGSVAVVDRTGGEVRIFDETGTHLRSMGRHGEGPGEFNDPWKIWVLPGDTLWVGDYRPWRYNVFAANGEWARAVTMDPVYPNPSRGGGVLDNGSSINTTDTWSTMERLDFTEHDSVMAEVHGPDGRRLGILAGLAGRRMGETRASTAVNLRLSVVFAASAFVDAGGSTIALAEGRDTQVRLLDERLRLRRIVRWSDPGREVAAADVRAWREDHIASRGGRDSPNWSEGFDDALVDPERPAADVFPAMSAVMLGRDWRVWVLPYRRPRAEAPRWLAFEPGGEFLCHLGIDHAGLNPYEIGTDYLLGVHTDELGVQVVRMYRLHLPAEAL